MLFFPQTQIRRILRAEVWLEISFQQNNFKTKRNTSKAFLIKQVISTACASVFPCTHPSRRGRKTSLTGKFWHFWLLPSCSFYSTVGSVSNVRSVSTVSSVSTVCNRALYPKQYMKAKHRCVCSVYKQFRIFDGLFKRQPLSRSRHDQICSNNTLAQGISGGR